MNSNITRLLVIVSLCLLLPLTTHAQEKRRPAQIAFNLYPYLSDVKTDADFTINMLVPLPARFSYFSFANFGDTLSSGDPDFLLTEQNLIWNVSEKLPLDLVAQDIIRRGHDNDTIHLGVRWRLNSTPMLAGFLKAINLNYSVQIFPTRIDQRDVGGWQISHAYQMTFPYISDRLYLGGFLDHNIDETSRPGFTRDNVVSETQFGVRLYRQLYAVVEYRINDYRRSDNTNVGAGLEIKTSW